MAGLLGGIARAQLSGAGSISGVVTDATGATVGEAAVTATNVATGVKTTRTTSSSGYYVLSPIVPGTYNVSVAARGFKTMTQDNVTVDALQVVGLNMVLQLGAVSETVVVNTAPPALDTANATLGNTVENQEYTALPLAMNGGARNATQFEYLEPGVSQGNSGSSGVFNGTGSVGRIDELYVDGVPLTRVSLQGDPRNVSASISVEAVDQFQVVTGGSPIAYQGVGMTNYVIKSGTNQLHGSLYDYFRNTALDTWGWSAPAAINPLVGRAVKPVERQNEFGAWLGGPLWKDRVFLFANYDGFRYTKVPNPSAATVPTMAERGGDFRDYAAATGQHIYDPATTVCNAGKCTRSQFNFNGIPDTIDPARFSGIATKLIQGLPQPTNTSQLTGNYLTSAVGNSYSWKELQKLDAVLTSKQHVSAVFSASKSSPYGYSISTPVLPPPWGTGQIAIPYTKDVILEHSYAISSHLVNQLSFGFVRYNDQVSTVDYNPIYGAASAYGIQGLPAGQVSNAFPTFGWSGTDALSAWNSGQKTYSEVTNTYDLVENLQYLHGKHSITVGGIRQWLQDNYTAYTTGTSPLALTFSAAQTGAYNSSGVLVSTSGNDFASFLLGQVGSASFSQYAVPASYGRMHPFSLYGEDDYAFSPKLKFNIGLRWDVFPPFFEAQNHLSFLNPTLNNPAVNHPGALEFAGNGTDACNCKSSIHTWYKDLGPRLGVAYSLNDKTVIRAGYAINFSHATGAQNIGRSGTGQLGYSTSASPPSPGSGLAVFVLDNGFPAYQQPPFINAGYGAGFSTAVSGSASSITYGDPYYGSRAPYAVNWNVGFERELVRNIVLNVNYVGSQGHFLPPASGNARGYWSNELDPKYYNLGTLLNASATPANVASAAAIDPGVALPYPTFGGTGATIAQMLLPFPQYKGVSDAYGNVANSSYHAMQLTLRKRMSNGLQFTVNYTYSKEIDNQGTYRNGYLPSRVERSRGTGDTPQLLSVTAVYNLPFGGSNQLGSREMVMRAITGGWSVSGIYTYSSGSPLTITGTCTTPNGGTCEPNYAVGYTHSPRINGSWGAGALAGQNSAPYIDKAAFIDPPAYSIGNLSRTAPYGLRGPSAYDLDLSLKRNFHIYERANLLFDVSMFNVTNKVEHSISSTAIDSGTFGQVGGQSNNSRDVQLAARINF
ncbi:MAG TPA: TonB-dependent receptor [Acidobacteriaceae bacterium]|nr:TonB-dependent receptor [Acidobacteriaceae bacterium]